MNVPATSSQINPTLHQHLLARRENAANTSDQRSPANTAASLSNAAGSERANRTSDTPVMTRSRADVMSRHARSAADGRQSTNAPDTKAATASTDSAAGPTPTDDPVNQLMAAWGKNDPDWDLNGDGTVDGADLAELIGKIAANTGETNGPAAGPATEATAPTTVDDPAKAQPTVDSLLKAWGTDDAAHDLNGDGQVDGTDLSILLGDMNHSSKETPTNDKPVTPTDDAATPTVAADDGQSKPTIDGLMSKWGTDDPEFDFNGDGVVDGADLAILLGQSAPQNAGGSPPPMMTTAGGAEGPSKYQPTSVTRGNASAPAYASKAAELADAVMNRLANSDQHDFSITDVRALVDNLNLSDGDKRALLNRVATQYGNGRAVNAIG